MASTLYASKVGSGVQPRANIELTEVHATYSLSAALVVNDVIQMVKIPAGATVISVTLAAADLDSSGTPAIVLTVGDGDDTDRFITTAVGTIAQAGGVCRLDNPVGLNHKYTADDTIDVKVTTAPGTGATSGDIDLSVIYTMAQ